MTYRRSSREVRRFFKGVLFASPWFIGFILWTVYPVCASLYYSFTRYNVFSPPSFIGLKNYARMVGDERFHIAVTNTLYFVLLGVPAALIVSFLAARLLNTDIRFRPAFRTIFYLPSIVPAVASAEVWRWVYNPSYGLINSALRSAGIAAIPWLSSPSLAKISLIIIQCWGQGTAIVVFLAALQDVPRSLYDAALVDGANALQRFWNVTIPMCSPAILFVAMTNVIWMFQYFTMGWLLTGGGPNQSTEMYSMYLYRSAFSYYDMGYASALGWIAFLIIVSLTILILRSSGRWVYYGGR